MTVGFMLRKLALIMFTAADNLALLRGPIVFFVA